MSDETLHTGTGLGPFAAITQRQTLDSRGNPNLRIDLLPAPLLNVPHTDATRPQQRRCEGGRPRTCCSLKPGLILTRCRPGGDARASPRAPVRRVEPLPDGIGLEGSTWLEGRGHRAGHDHAFASPLLRCSTERQRLRQRQHPLVVRGWRGSGQPGHPVQSGPVSGAGFKGVGLFRSP
jgi:hypothetical protein